METRPTWNTKVLDSINRMMIRLSRMAVSWILREERVSVNCTQDFVNVGVFVFFNQIWVLGTFPGAGLHEKYQLNSRFSPQQLTESINQQIEQQEAELDQ